MDHSNDNRQVEAEMQIDEGFTIQELEKRLEMFYCCAGSDGGPSCGSGSR